MINTQGSNILGNYNLKLVYIQHFEQTGEKMGKEKMSLQMFFGLVLFKHHARWAFQELVKHRA